MSAAELTPDIARSICHWGEVATPTLMMAPVSAGTLNGVCVRNSTQTMPASAAGNAVTMMNASVHDWKLTTMSR